MGRQPQSVRLHCEVISQHHRGCICGNHQSCQRQRGKKEDDDHDNHDGDDPKKRILGGGGEEENKQGCCSYLE